MRVDSEYRTCAHRKGTSEKPRRQQPNHAPIRPNERNRPDYRQLIGVGVLIAAFIVLLWPTGSLIPLALGSALLALLLVGGVLLMRRHHSR